MGFGTAQTLGDTFIARHRRAERTVAPSDTPLQLWNDFFHGNAKR